MKIIAFVLALFIAQPSQAADNLQTSSREESLISNTFLRQLKEKVVLPYDLVQQIGDKVVPIRLELQADGRIKVYAIAIENAYAEMQLRKALESLQIAVPKGFQELELAFNLRVQISAN